MFDLPQEAPPVNKQMSLLSSLVLRLRESLSAFARLVTRPRVSSTSDSTSNAIFPIGHESSVRSNSLAVDS